MSGIKVNVFFKELKFKQCFRISSDFHTFCRFHFVKPTLDGKLHVESAQLTNFVKKIAPHEDIDYRFLFTKFHVIHKGCDCTPRSAK